MFLRHMCVFLRLANKRNERRSGRYTFRTMRNATHVWQIRSFSRR